MLLFHARFSSLVAPCIEQQASSWTSGVVYTPAEGLEINHMSSPPPSSSNDGLVQVGAKRWDGRHTSATSFTI